ncbi:methionyl-tRNA formyltransferase, partial [Paenibacillus sepulcri]|nr:methionyl-tRNA formyltransferase [Paenibacillus sepulcri]
TLLNGETFKVWGCRPLPPTAASGGQPGTVMKTDEKGILVQTGEGMLLLTVIQPSGKKAMPASEWLKGARLEAGTVFGGVQL